MKKVFIIFAGILILSATFSAGYIFRGTTIAQNLTASTTDNTQLITGFDIPHPSTNADTYPVADPTPITIKGPSHSPTPIPRYRLEQNVSSQEADKRDVQRKKDISFLGTAAEVYFNENNGIYPQELLDLVNNGQIENLPLAPAYKNEADVLYQLLPCPDTGEIMIWIPLEAPSPVHYYVYFTRFGQAYTVTQKLDNSFCSLSLKKLEEIKR